MKFQARRVCVSIIIARMPTCPVCNRFFPLLKRCSGCREVLYCEKKCQKKAWASGHNLDCRGETKKICIGCNTTFMGSRDDTLCSKCSHVFNQDGRYVSLKNHLQLTSIAANMYAHAAGRISDPGWSVWRCKLCNKGGSDGGLGNYRNGVCYKCWRCRICNKGGSDGGFGSYRNGVCYKCLITIKGSVA